jgi:hypothetical protein
MVTQPTGASCVLKMGNEQKPPQNAPR